MGTMGDDLPEVQLGSDSFPIDVALGWHHSCALFANGRVKCWGHADLLGLEDSTNHRGDLSGPVLPRFENAETLRFLFRGPNR